MNFALPIYVAIILQQDNQFLLLQRKTDKAISKNQWEFPGGALQAGETLMQGAIRKAQQELNVTIHASDLKLVHVLHIHQDADNESDMLGFYFVAKKWQGIPVNNEPDKHAHIQWFTMGALPLTPTEYPLQALLKHDVTYSEHGWHHKKQ